MAFVCEVSCTGPEALVAAASSWFEAGPAKAWASLPGLSALDVYRPLEGGAHDPFNNDKNAPLLMVMAEFVSEDGLNAARPAIERDLAGLPAGVRPTLTAMERKFYPVGAETRPSPLNAPFSYVVRYHRPAEDEAAFIKNYVDTHPGTLGTLPRIRSVMCYFPLKAQPAQRYSAADYMIGNEVVFDSVEDFNAAMQSPVRQELRQHFREFPPFTGLNTHFPMRRTRYAG